MTRFSYSVDKGHTLPRLGLVVLQVDETIEPEFRLHFGPEDAAIHVSRVPSGDDLTPDTIDDMATALPRAAGLLPQAVSFDVLAYACTSASMRFGPDRVADLLRQGARARHVTNPFSAALAAFDHLGVRRIGLVSPYIDSVAGPMAQAFAAAGVEVTRSLSFGEREEARVARITRASVEAAAMQVGAGAGVDAVFLSCTNLRTAGVIEALRDRLGKPVLSSNLALAWHMGRLSGGACRTGLG
jgi:maleate isomerase